VTTRSALIADAARLGTVLGIWAHPDDETFLSAGLMAAARDAGNRVVCVTATLGEHGTDDPEGWPPDRLGAIRQHELHASLAALDVTEHHLLGLADGALAAQPAHVITRHLARIVDIVEPDTILTFGPDGITGHEDHQIVSAWATAAHAAAAPEARLLYATTTEEFVQAWEPFRGAFNPFLVAGLPLRTRESDLAVSLRLEPAAVDRKIVALRAQASQTARLFATVGEERVRQWWSTETFVAASTAHAREQKWGTWRTAATARAERVLVSPAGLARPEPVGPEGRICPSRPTHSIDAASPLRCAPGQ
jgi:LmbE family N-acetylglucosaminyl deacetylase